MGRKPKNVKSDGATPLEKNVEKVLHSNYAKKHGSIHIGSVLFPNISEDKYFVLSDGRKLSDYRQLADALETMSDEVYVHHVNSERNDFATWISDIFIEPSLADAIRAAPNRTETRLLLYKHVLERLEHSKG